MIPYVAQNQCISMLNTKVQIAFCTPCTYVFSLGNKYLKLDCICSLLLNQLWQRPFVVDFLVVYKMRIWGPDCICSLARPAMAEAISCGLLSVKACCFHGATPISFSRDCLG
jgi:hypothetical protein